MTFHCWIISRTCIKILCGHFSGLAMLGFLIRWMWMSAFIISGLVCVGVYRSDENSITTRSIWTEMVSSDKIFFHFGWKLDPVCRLGLVFAWCYLFRHLKTGGKKSIFHHLNLCVKFTTLTWEPMSEAGLQDLRRHAGRKGSKGGKKKSKIHLNFRYFSYFKRRRRKDVLVSANISNMGKRWHDSAPELASCYISTLTQRKFRCFKWKHCSFEKRVINQGHLKYSPLLQWSLQGTFVESLLKAVTIIL